MNAYVVGAGAVGSFLGDRLRAAAASVTYAPRSLAEVTPVPADLAIVAVKSFDTPSAIATLERALEGNPGATILTVQNGVGNEEALAAAFGENRIVAGALTVPVERAADGSFAAAQDGGLGLAPVGTVSHNWLIAAFERTGLPVTAVSDYRALKWSKLMLNIIANATCAILDVLPEEIVRDARLFDLELRALVECRAAMRALKIEAVDLPRYPVRALGAALAFPRPIARAILGARIAGARGTKPPSLLLDMRAHRPRSEVEVLNGAIAAAGAREGFATPVNAALTRVLVRIAADPAAWPEYRGRPDALLAANVRA